jgi:hypothetical protein
MGSGKVIDLPERQLVGALERAVEALSAEVEAALAQANAERAPIAIADEELARLAGSRGGTGGLMARGVGERPERSVTTHLESVEYPADRDDLVEAAEDAEAPVEVINLLKSLPRDRYESEEMVLRDLGEAARRFIRGGHPEQPFGSIDRRNLGRDAVEENVDGNPRHP